MNRVRTIERSRIRTFYVILIGVLLSLPLILFGYPDPTHDGWIHIQWLECFSHQLWHGEIYPRWLSQPNHGFGSACFFFYPPLPFYAASLFYPFAPSIAQAGFALGWAAALGLVLSGIAALLCFRRFVDCEWAAIVGAVIYMIAPYHLAIDLLDRGANAEFWAFIWFPLIIAGLQDLSLTCETRNVDLDASNQRRSTRESSSKLLTLALTIAGLFLTHPLTAVAFAPIATAFAAFRGVRTLVASALAAMLAAGLAAIYWIPLFAYRGFTKGSEMGYFDASSVFFPSFSWTEPLIRNDPFNVRLLHIFLAFALADFAAIVAILTMREKRRTFGDLVFWTVGLGFCLFMMLPLAMPIYEHFTPMRRVQFTWRFMSSATLAHSFLSCLLLDFLWKDGLRIKSSALPVILGHCASVIVTGSALYLALTLGAEKYKEGFWQRGAFRQAPPSIDPSAPDANGEHKPLASNTEAARRFFPETESAAPKLLATDGSLEGIHRSARWWRLEVLAKTNCSIIIPQFWFPGWRASTLDRRKTFPVHRALDSGLLLIDVPRGIHSIDLCLVPLWPESLGKMMSVSTGLGTILALVILRHKSVRAPVTVH